MDAPPVPLSATQLPFSQPDRRVEGVGEPCKCSGLRGEGFHCSVNAVEGVENGHQFRDVE
jgi:hypothetical protein